MPRLSLTRLLAVLLTAAVATLAVSGIAAAETKTFHKPLHPQGNRLDWCFNWAQGCGQQAADAFCKHHGFTTAQTFSKATDIGDKHKTRVIATGAASLAAIAGTTTLNW